MSREVPRAPDHTVQQSTPGLGAVNRQLVSVIRDRRRLSSGITAARSDEWTPSAAATKS
jgi:hypothetical protein